MNQKKTYKFEAIASEHVSGYVDAYTEEEAIDYINMNQYDELMDSDELNIEEVISIGEQEDE